MRHLWPLRDQLEFATREHLHIASLPDSERLRAVTDIFEKVVEVDLKMKGTPLHDATIVAAKPQ